MDILIIGGTRFLGRHLVAAAQTRGHRVTLFHRGTHRPDFCSPVEEIFGDRNQDIDKLGRRRWDAVIDTCGYLPAAVRAAAQTLRAAVGQYAFISSISAYADFTTLGYDETTPLATLTVEQTARVPEAAARPTLTAAGLGDLYGGLKAGCEAEVAQVFGPGALLVRPGVLAGPFDPTDRLAYWVSRIGAGGEVLLPGRPQRLVQFIDARDVADWVVQMLERQRGGAYNVVRPPQELTFGGLCEAIRTATGSLATFTWVSEEFLRRQAVQPWTELPLYLPESEPATRGFLTAAVGKAVAENLTFRPLAATIRDTLAGRTTAGGGLGAGLSPAREQALLGHWHAQKEGG